MYSLAYPSSWHDIPASKDGSHYGKDFVNEAIGSPEQLSPTWIWLNVQVDTQPTQACSMSGSIPPSVATRQVSTDGATGTQYVSESGAAGPYALRNGWCYSFRFLTSSRQDFEQHVSEVDTILGSFRFNR